MTPEELVEAAMNNLHYDRAGNPIDMWAWIDLKKDYENTVVALTPVGDLVVSTIWLGLDHALPRFDGSEHRPLIFESMIFDRSLPEDTPDGEPSRWTDMGCQRYSTEVEALEGHTAMVSELLAMLGIPDSVEDWMASQTPPDAQNPA